ncbi:hypothetical protein OUZ56_030539 [Daphnia magna]|uniref:Uncharacterized protein n=1 Tax=Daphnia magna TaxID=35525 RepID=A0ABQ9ZSI7_9CRUS|nr:hypothetical protein OUZ56_030539 [Daphnia magna]
MGIENGLLIYLLFPTHFFVLSTVAVNGPQYNLLLFQLTELLFKQAPSASITIFFFEVGRLHTNLINQRQRIQNASYAPKWFINIKLSENAQTQEAFLFILFDITKMRVKRKKKMEAGSETWYAN